MPADKLNKFPFNTEDSPDQNTLDDIVAGLRQLPLSDFDDGTPQTGPASEIEDDEVEDDSPSLKQGYIQTSRNSAVYNILIIGETGVGKSSVVELLANVLAGKSVDNYDFSVIDRHNETGGSQSQSQTNDTRLYEFTSTNGVKVRILDTPGVADTRGLRHDEQHKENIISSIAKNFEFVDAVVIIANGTVPRLTVSTDYALATLSSILPNTLANNIAFLFTNVPSALGWNFAEDSLPLPVRGCTKFLLNNPLALQKRFIATDVSSTSAKQLALMRKEIFASELNALDTLTECFDWLNKLTPQPTLPLQALHDQSKIIDSKIADICRQTDRRDSERHSETWYYSKITSAVQEMNAYSNYQTTSWHTVWTRQSTSRHNVLCDYPGCHENCDEACRVPYTVDSDDLRYCSLFKRGRRTYSRRCDECGHSRDDHGHYYSKWVQESRMQVDVNQYSKGRWESAKSEKDYHEYNLASTRRTLVELDAAIDRDKRVVANLVSSYSSVALSGSFTSPIEKSRARLEQSLQSMQECS